MRLSGAFLRADADRAGDILDVMLADRIEPLLALEQIVSAAGNLDIAPRAVPACFSRASGRVGA